MGRLDGKTAIVTGAGSGIGAATAELFCQEGARVVAVDVTGREAETAERCGALCTYSRTDVSDESAMKALFALVEERFGRLDVLFNNAGISGAIGRTADYEVDDFDRIWKTNCRATFLGMKLAIPLMLRGGGGSIINTSSVAALVVFPQMPAYAASKAGVAMLTKVTAAEYASEQIRVNAIMPAVIDTGMTQALPEHMLAAALAGTPTGRLGRPAEVANLALYLASETSSFITGTLIPIDGGYTLL